MYLCMLPSDEDWRPPCRTHAQRTTRAKTNSARNTRIHTFITQVWLGADEEELHAFVEEAEGEAAFLQNLFRSNNSNAGSTSRVCTVWCCSVNVWCACVMVYVGERGCGTVGGV